MILCLTLFLFYHVVLATFKYDLTEDARTMARLHQLPGVPNTFHQVILFDTHVYDHTLILTTDHCIHQRILLATDFSARELIFTVDVSKHEVMSMYGDLSAPEPGTEEGLDFLFPIVEVDEAYESHLLSTLPPSTQEEARRNRQSNSFASITSLGGESEGRDSDTISLSGSFADEPRFPNLKRRQVMTSRHVELQPRAFHDLGLNCNKFQFIATTFCAIDHPDLPSVMGVDSFVARISVVRTTIETSTFMGHSFRNTVVVKVGKRIAGSWGIMDIQTDDEGVVFSYWHDIVPLDDFSSVRTNFFGLYRQVNTCRASVGIRLQFRLYIMDFNMDKPLRWHPLKTNRCYPIGPDKSSVCHIGSLQKTIDRRFEDV